MIEKIVSVATIDDIGVWSLGSRYVKKFIHANEYRVVVPKKYVQDFLNENQAAYSVVPEDDILPTATINKIKGYFESSSASYGWYLQQFLKIEELRKKSKKAALIWDADTIPLKFINFEDSDGRLLSYKGVEHHSPYFQTIENILGVRKTNNHSFISQCACIRMIDIHEMCEEIEQRNGVYWIDSILNAIKPEHGYFSEYETIGSYINSRPSETTLFYKNVDSWTRNGYKYIPSLFLFPFLFSIYSKRFDHMTFEKWGKPSYKKILIRILAK